MADDARPIIIKRIKKVSGGAHGGAWKVAYADFVTAMMAFFMLLWLLNATTKEQKEGLAEYFTPTTASTSSSSGSDGILGGVSLNSDGAQASAVTVSIPATEEVAAKETDKEDTVSEEAKFAAMVAKKEQAYFEQMSEEIKVAIQESPELSKLQDQMLLDITEDGMRIQLVDKDNRAMFRSGSAELYNYAEKMIQAVAAIVVKMPNRISITGHTDAAPFTSRKNYSNWELSADRANATRRVLSAANVSVNRIAEVLGKASTEPLLPDRPMRAENRRITILLLRESPSLPADFM
ncbi:MAG: flagellar motor protein MotB [Emcibacter sp.]|nr:flagellar motor protein MotB [Emcibacter sp.]